MFQKFKLFQEDNSTFISFASAVISVSNPLKTCKEDSKSSIIPILAWTKKGRKWLKRAFSITKLAYTSWILPATWETLGWKTDRESKLYRVIFLQAMWLRPLISNFTQIKLAISAVLRSTGKITRALISFHKWIPEIHLISLSHTRVVVYDKLSSFHQWVEKLLRNFQPYLSRRAISTEQTCPTGKQAWYQSWPIATNKGRQAGQSRINTKPICGYLHHS